MGISTKEATLLWIKLSPVRDRVAELYWNKSVPREKKLLYGTKAEYYYNWIKFRSETEIRRYKFLMSLQLCKLITSFEYEPEKFLLIDTLRYDGVTYKMITYTPDFKITTIDGSIIYEDTKSVATAKDKTYKVKKRLFIEKYILWTTLSFKEVLDSEDNYFLSNTLWQNKSNDDTTTNDVMSLIKKPKREKNSKK